MRRLLLPLLILAATPAFADLRPNGTTALLGMGVAQDGAAIPLSHEDGAYVAEIVRGRFLLTFPGQSLEVVGVTFGRENLFDLIDLPPETGLFGPGTAYARFEGPEAEHFMTDPLCASATYGPGYNYLDETRATAAGYPISAVEVDSASRSCTAADRLPSRTDLVGMLPALYVVVRTDAGIERLIVRFVGS